MVKGLVFEKEFSQYTDMHKLLLPLQKAIKNYNWLLTDCECNHYPAPEVQPDRDFIWLEGAELLAILSKHDIQFIWAVFSAFSPKVSLQSVLAKPLPLADGGTSFWESPPRMQHPLAEVEIVAWDSSLTLFMSRDDVLANKLLQQYPSAVDLVYYNATASSING